MPLSLGYNAIYNKNYPYSRFVSFIWIHFFKFVYLFFMTVWKCIMFGSIDGNMYSKQSQGLKRSSDLFSEFGRLILYQISEYLFYLLTESLSLFCTCTVTCSERSVTGCRAFYILPQTPVNIVMEYEKKAKYASTTCFCSS